MNRTVVIDTGPLIALSLVKLLPALPEFFDDIYVTGTVLNEAMQDASSTGAQEVARAWKEGWIVSYPVTDTPISEDLIAMLDLGLAESIAVAEKTKAMLVVDDPTARRIIKRKGLKAVSLPALLVATNKAGFLHRLKPALVTLADAGYKFSPQLIKHVLAHSE